MADFSKFRTAFNGFNRVDVAEYIENTALEHRRELEQLRAENKRLLAEKQAAEEALRQAQSGAAPAEQPKQEPICNVTEQELEAYRRAEAAERSALQRAARLREKLEALCGDAAERCAETQACAKQAAEEAAGSAAKLQHTAQELEKLLNDVQSAVRSLELPE